MTVEESKKHPTRKQKCAESLCKTNFRMWIKYINVKNTIVNFWYDLNLIEIFGITRFKTGEHWTINYSDISKQKHSTQWSIIIDKE